MQLARPMGDGHWVGLLWLAYEGDGKREILRGQKVDALIEYRKTDTWTHDLGSCWASRTEGYYIVGDPHYKEVPSRRRVLHPALNPHIGIVQWHSTRTMKG